MTDGLKDKYRKAIIGILSSNERVERVALIGSRAMGTFTVTSDVDIALFGDKLTLGDQAKLAEEIEALSIPQPVDLLLHRTIKSKELLKHIQHHGVEWWRRDGGLGSEWKEYRLADAVNLIGGGTPKRSHPEYWGGAIPWLSVKDFNNGYRHVDSAEESITEIGLAKSSTKILTESQLIISARGTVGALAQMSKPMAFNQSCYGIDAKPEQATNDFLYYLIKCSISNFKQITHGAVFDTITRETFEHILVKLPPLPEQRAIAHILGSLEDKIELNRQMNQTLEKMAQAIFKSWFIDFDPVLDNALRAGNPIPESMRERAEIRRRRLDQNQPSPPLLPEGEGGKSSSPSGRGGGEGVVGSEAFDHLFPDSFEDSALGEIPKGWAVRPIGDVVQCVGGATPSTKKAEFWDGGTNPFLTPKDMSSLITPVILNTDRHITDAGVKKISSKRLPAGTVILSSRAPIGYLAINEVPVSVNQGIIAMICNGDLPNHYVLLWTMASMETIKGKAGGTTFAEISKKNFRPIPALIPISSILNAFTKQVEPLFQQVVENVVSAESLARIRDTLLPKLISGELPIPDAEKLAKYSEQGNHRGLQEQGNHGGLPLRGR